MAATEVDEVTGPSPDAAGDACAPGETLSGRYRVVRFIARGGAGAVYEADDLVVGTPVALKVLHPERALSATAVERVHRELALARRITHRNVCRVHDVGEDAGRLFLTMELLDGETLAARIARGPLTSAELDAIAEQLVAALAAAHAEGVVHRDFKPQNVILVEDRVVVTDFGLARSTLEDDAAVSLTGDAAMIGTPAYMAPEQVEGRDATVATDIYALGVVLFELATGRPPFRESTALATATARLHRDPPRMAAADLDRRWADVIARCLQRDPARRFATVTEVLAARRGPRRRGVRVAAIAGLIAASALAVGVVARAGSSDPAPAANVLPAHVRPASTKAAVMFERANAALEAGDRVAARSLLEIGAADSPDDPIAQTALAEVLDALGLEERAVEATRRAARTRDALGEEARLYVEAVEAEVLGEDARELWKRAVALAPREATYRLRYARALAASGQPEPASRELAAVRLPPVTAALAGSEIAQARGDTRAALVLALKAARLATRPNDHARALVQAAAARWRLADPIEAARDYERALVLGDSGVALQARAGLLALDISADRIASGARRYLDQAALVRSLGDRVRLVDLLLGGASIMAQVGLVTEAEAAVAEAREHATALGNATDIAWADAAEANVALGRGQLARAAALGERAFVAGRQAGAPGVQGSGFFSWTHALLELDDAAALAAARALRTETTERFVDFSTAYREGDLDRAARIASAMANRDTYEGRQALLVIAQVAIDRGQLDDAERRLADIAPHVLGDGSSILARDRLERAQAALLARRGKLAEALAQLDRHAERCAKGSLVGCEVRALALAARLALDGGAPDAQARMTAALARAEQLDMRRTMRELRAAR